MSMPFRPSRIASLCALVATLSPAWAGDRYDVVDVTPAGARTCMANALNASGQVVGRADVGVTAAAVRGFVTGPAGRDPRVVGTLGGTWSGLTSIADNGVAVGWSYVAGDTAEHAVLLRAGATTPDDLGSLGGPYASAERISAKGHLVVGLSAQPDGTWAGWTLDLRAPTRALVPLGTGVLAYALAPAGAIAGAIAPTDWSREDAYVSDKHGTNRRMLGSLGGAWTTAYGINRFHEVVGSSTAADGSTHAFVTGPGGADLHDVGVPGVWAAAGSINAHGRLVGLAAASNSQPGRAFVADRGGRWRWLDELVTLSAGQTLVAASGINDAGQIAATTSDDRCVLLTPR